MRRGGFVLIAALSAGWPGPLAADEPAGCRSDEVTWNGRCFGRYEWDVDEQSCPDGVIVIPEGERRPRCTPCAGYGGMQQPINYCAGLRATRTEAKMNDALQAVLGRLPERESEIRAAQEAWTASRDKACHAREKAFEGGSMASEAAAECRTQRARKRIAELNKMIEPPATPESKAAGLCGGTPTEVTLVDRRASVVADRSRFHSEPRACAAGQECGWLRKGYVLRGDEVAVSAVSGGFACVTFKATTGWLPRRDLCEAGTDCERSATPDAPARAGALPFKVFCEQAFATKTADETTLLVIEGLLRVDGCDQLEEAIKLLKNIQHEDVNSFYGLARKMTSLAALAYAPGLQRIELPYKTPIADLGPLENLTDLVAIEISASRVKDLRPLRRLTKLEFLDVRTSKVKDISPLMDLPKLKKLDVRNLRLPPGQIEAFRNKHPNAEINY